MQTVLLDWPYLALVLAAVWLAVLLLKPWPDRTRDPVWLLWLLGPVYMLHQFEEHGIDALGRHYAFLGEMCAVLGFPGGEGCPADEAFIFAVNPVAVWLAALVAGLAARRRPMVGACAWGIPLVNMVTHIASAVAHHSYNPGVLTSAVLFAPVCLWVVRTLRAAGLLDAPRIAAMVASGVAVHAVLIGGLLAREHGLIGEGVLLASQALNGLVPAAIGLLVGSPRPAAAVA